MSDISQDVTLQQIADAMHVSKRAVEQRAKRGHWPYTEQNTKGGKMRLYAIADLPSDLQPRLIVAMTRQAEPAAPVEPDRPIGFQYDRESLWEWADRKTQKQRDQGARRAQLLIQCLTLMDTLKITFGQAADMTAAHNNISAASLKNWYYGVNKQVGARHYDRIDWPVALIPGYRPRARSAEFDAAAWDWFKGHYLQRRGPSIASSYRRLQEVAAKQGWAIPCENTVRHRVYSDIPITTRVLKREGEEALNKLYPAQQRDKRCFSAGEAVSGDGLKFDKLWIDWGDEIINTTTGWFWQDIYSNKILAHRIAKTENTDVFRLATYDMTSICAPSYVQVDNTRVAANKAMTGQTQTRYRFKKIEDEATGLLPQMGMQVHFTNPDHTMSNPGVKPVERSFGIGGLHSEVATHPALINRGFSKATAVPIDEFMAIVAEEVARFNARPKRRTEVCGGLKSFDDAFAESFAKSTVRQLTESQRRLLLLMTETARVSAAGEVKINAGANGVAKNRYWHPALSEYKGDTVQVYYDPENLSDDLAVYSLDGRHLCDAEHKAGVAFNDTLAGREHHKYKKRIRKAQKQIADNETRMTDLERAALYPAPAEPVEIPPPGVVQGNFRQKQQVDEDLSVMKPARAVGGEDELWQNFSANVANLKRKRDEDLI